MKRLLLVFALIAVPAFAQDAPSLSEPAIEAAELRVRAERWGRVADHSLQAFGLSSAAGLAMTGITEQHPRRTRVIDLMWVASGTAWLAARLTERTLRKRAEALEARQPTAESEQSEPTRLSQSISNAVDRATESIEAPPRPRWSSTSRIRSLWAAYERQAYENTRHSMPRGVDSVRDGAAPTDGPPDRP